MGRLLQCIRDQCIRDSVCPLRDALLQSVDG